MNGLAWIRNTPWLVLALLCSLAADLAAAGADAIAKANEEYKAGRFAEAAQLYESAIKAGETNAALFYNLGNAKFKTDKLGHAVLNYERALALEPQHPEALANLGLARDRARALELQRKRWDRVTARISVAQSSITVSASFWIAAFALAGLLTVRRRSGWLAGLLVMSLVVLALSAAALYLRETGNKGRDFAIVTEPKVEARVATADSAGTVLMLPPGSEIKILSTRGDWIYAALPNELRGWLPARSAERVRL